LNGEEVSIDDVEFEDEEASGESEEESNEMEESDEMVEDDDESNDTEDVEGGEMEDDQQMNSGSARQGAGDSYSSHQNPL